MSDPRRHISSDFGQRVPANRWVPTLIDTALPEPATVLMVVRGVRVLMRHGHRQSATLCDGSFRNEKQLRIGNRF